MGWGKKDVTVMITGRQKLGCNLIEAATLSVIHQINCHRASGPSGITAVGTGPWQLAH